MTDGWTDTPCYGDARTLDSGVLKSLFFPFRLAIAATSHLVVVVVDVAEVDSVVGPMTAHATNVNNLVISLGIALTNKSPESILFIHEGDDKSSPRIFNVFFLVPLPMVTF